jgi:hypothetical protein
MARGEVIYQELCFACHGADGRGAPMVGRPGEKLAPSFVASPRVFGTGEGAIRVIPHGLTGDIDGKEYGRLMVPMGINDDQWIADVTPYLRNSFGNKASLISPQTVSKLRKEHSGRKESWTIEEFEKLEPPSLGCQSSWKLNASHKAGESENGFRWRSGQPVFEW